MNLVNEFKENGYVICKNIVDLNLLDNHLSSIYNFFKIYCKPSKELQSFDKPWHTELFHKEIINFRQKNPDLFSCFYDSLQNTSTLTSLVFTKKLLNISAKLLGVRNNQLIAVGQQTRVDVPHDKRNILNWHQDWSYFPSTKEGITFWLPLYKMSDEIGYLKVLEKSHNEGSITKTSDKLDEKKAEKIKYMVTHQMEMPENIIKKYEIKDVVISRGDVVFFDTCLFHKSGHNKSNRIRFTCQNRIQNSVSKDYIPFRLNIKSNPNTTSFLKS